RGWCPRAPRVAESGDLIRCAAPPNPSPAGSHPATAEAVLDRIRRRAARGSLRACAPTRRDRDDRAHGLLVALSRHRTFYRAGMRPCRLSPCPSPAVTSTLLR